MQINLLKTDEEVLKALKTLKTRSDVADLLEVTDKTLIFLLYRNKGRNYRELKIPKKSGGYRTIHVPISTLKILQKKLSKIIYLVSNPKSCVHGFCLGRDIRSNAQNHIRRKHVVNIDLQDFFNTIEIGRVVGLFMAKPFSLPKGVAVVLAQICCSPLGYLPQGAPTSPVISNMICSRMDGQLGRFARMIRCKYTRYADDITLSSDSTNIPRDLAEVGYVDGKVVVTLGERIVEIINSNDFSINHGKTTYRNTGRRQEVTGLVVNQRVNVKRKFMRQVRGMLHRHKTDTTLSEIEKSTLLRIIKGKLNFIRLVRSSKDRAYRVLANEYHEIMGMPLYSLDAIDTIKKNTWILEVDGRDNGSAFSMGDTLVTCEHVIRNGTSIKACRWVGDRKEKYSVSVTAQNRGLDLAKLSFIDSPPATDPLDKGDSSIVIERQLITVAGYPYYVDGRAVSYYDAKVIAKRENVIPIFYIDRPLVSGMSGGPALNSANEVIGVLKLGAGNQRESEDMDVYGILPINYIDQV